MSDLSEKSCNMFFQNMREVYCAMCGPGSKMDISAVVESEKMRNSCMSGSQSIISWTSLEACANAIISASWLLALFARGTLNLNSKGCRVWQPS